MDRAPGDLTLAVVDLRGAPIRRLFDPLVGDGAFERERLAAWRLPLQPHPYWRAPSPFAASRGREAGIAVLECRARDAALIAGDEDWADYTVAARVRLLGGSAPPVDEERPGDTEAGAGLVARYRTSRHHYSLAATSTGRLVLSRRVDLERRVLAEAPLAVGGGRGTLLALEVSGRRLRASVDGVRVLEAEDDLYPTGPGGIRVRGHALLEDVRIEAASGEEAARTARRTARLDAEARVRSGYPGAQLLARWPKPRWPHELSTICRIAPGGGWGALMYNSASAFSPKAARRFASKSPPRLGVADTEGHLLWGRLQNVRFPLAHDFDGDGRCEILCLLDGRMALLSPEDGSVVREAPLPRIPGGEAADPDLPPFHPADLSGAGRRRDFIFREDRDSHGGQWLWAYDHELRPLWTARVGHPRYGHTISTSDIDGDGREETLAGFHCFDADGRLLWKCRETEENADDHVDEVQLGLFGPEGEPRACGTNGSDGVYLLDGASGEVIARHRFGHVQGLSVGRFLDGGSGGAYCVGTRWGGPGILNVLDPEGRVAATWEPDNVSQGGPPVSWTGDGRQLIFLSTSPEAFGLWDGRGRRCVELACPELPRRGSYGIQKGQGAVLDIDGDGRDELVFPFPEATFVYGAAR
jgi:hypothetical protein